jgi:hypothetical protein
MKRWFLRILEITCYRNVAIVFRMTRAPQISLVAPGLQGLWPRRWFALLRRLLGLPIVTIKMTEGLPFVPGPSDVFYVEPLR